MSAAEQEAVEYAGSWFPHRGILVPVAPQVVATWTDDDQARQEHHRKRGAIELGYWVRARVKWLDARLLDCERRRAALLTTLERLDAEIAVLDGQRTRLGGRR
jgi:hypothetical protein